MNCILYANSGVNTVNIPDSPAKLRAWGTVIKSTVLDCIQNYFLTSISVKLDWNTAKEVDYVEVDGFFYFVDDMVMTSYDVARFTLIPDAITSAGGPSSLEYLDGVTERHHVPKSLDTFGAYTEADPLISPSRVLRLNMASEYFDNVGDYNKIDVVESPIDLRTLGGTGYLYEGRTFEDPSNELTVTVPSVPYVNNYTTFRMFGIATRTAGTMLFDLEHSAVQKGIQVCRDLGIENGIIAQYSIPGTMFGVTKNDGYITEVYSNGGTVDVTTCPFIYADNVRNARIFYGETSKYGIITAAGNVSEFNPEEIYYAGKQYPTLICQADGRYNGRPYFTFDYYHGEKVVSSPANFFTNSAGGMEWRNVPLRYVTPSHSVQDSYKLRSQRREEVLSKDYQERENRAQRFGLLGQFAGASAGAVASPSPENIANLGTTIASVMSQGSALVAQRDYNRERYKIATEREMIEFGYSQSVVTPEILFPFQTPSIRDFYGNGVTPYRYELDNSDITRIDKLLTMYGYKHTTPVVPSLFSNRPHFNFVKANGVTIGHGSAGGDLPRWWKELIRDQFSAGVRVWHVKPDASYYTQNE